MKVSGEFEAEAQAKLRAERRKPAKEGSGPRAWLVGALGQNGDRTYRLRLVIQTGFALGCILLGVQFARFTRAAMAGDLPLPARPAGVEGFLPISGLMGLFDWVYQGTLNRVHPAATPAADPRGIQTSSTGC